MTTTRAKKTSYELLYYFDKVLTIRGTLLGVITRKQFADLMKDTKNWASRIGSAATYSIEDLETAVSEKNVRLVMRYADSEDRERKLFITGEIKEASVFDVNCTCIHMTDTQLCQLQVQ